MDGRLQLARKGTTTTGCALGHDFGRAGLHPLQQRRFDVANGPTDPDVRVPIAVHPRLSEPREADFEGS